MSELEIFEGVQKIILAHSPERLKIEKVDGNLKILQDLRVNSARLVDIILELEDRFNISISDDDADGIRTIDDAARLVARLM